MLKILDQDGQAGCQYLFCLEPIDIKKLMYGPGYTVLGAINITSLLEKFFASYP